MTTRAAVLAAFVVAVEPTTGVAGRVYRSRALALDKAKLPAIVIRPLSEAVGQETHSAVDRRLEVAVEVHTRGAAPDVLAEPIVSSAHALIMGDPTLAGLVVDVSEVGTDWEIEDADSQAAMVTTRYAVYYRTGREAV